MKTLTDWLHQLERLHYKAIDMGLERVSQVAQQLGLLHSLPYIITIGGTNGKGSTVAFLESILLDQGYNVGAYTSPHLIDFNERVRINGAQVPDQPLIAAFEQIDAVRGDISLTYFEFTTLAAMWVFRQLGLDVILLEVGLGGRLDAVNIWDADIAVVTSIDLDHQQFLGDTREKIGLEKIGIGRPGKPLILGDAAVPSLVLESARALGFILLQAEQHFFASENPDRSGFWQFDGVAPIGNRVLWDALPMPRLYWRNAALALQVLAWTPFKIDADCLSRGLQSASLTGRQEIIGESPTVMLDVGHNPHAAAHLAASIRYRSSGRTYCIVGMLRDKAVADTLAELLAVVDVWLPVSLSGDRGLDGQVIADLLLESGAHVQTVYATPHEAYRKLLASIHPEDLVLVFGSFYTVADVLQYHRSMGGEG